MVEMRDKQRSCVPAVSLHVYTLCTLQPFVPRNDLVVTPVLALLDDVSAMEGLCPAPRAVAHIFHLPPQTLSPCSTPSWRARRYSCRWAARIGSNRDSSKMYRRNFTDASRLHSTYRIHRFWSTASSVKGVTEDNSLATVRISYARDCISAPLFTSTAATLTRCADNCQGMIATSSLGCSSQTYSTAIE
ncbi:hypothetical protein BJV78DRAFT_721432 [Lactifluus subvellereus]|nr:hypothetical protein BJV78DRAFT_721432 [Lactifluus subvellereus]